MCHGSGRQIEFGAQPSKQDTVTQKHTIHLKHKTIGQNDRKVKLTMLTRSIHPASHLLGQSSGLLLLVFCSRGVPSSPSLPLPPGNNTCFYGKCYYCRESEPACAEGEVMEGSLTLWLPDVWPLQKHRHPWGRTYREGKLARWVPGSAHFPFISWDRQRK